MKSKGCENEDSEKKKIEFLWKTSTKLHPTLLFEYDAKLFCVVCEISNLVNDALHILHIIYRLR